MTNEVYFKATVPGSDDGTYFFQSEIDCQKSFELTWSKVGKVTFSKLQPGKVAALVGGNQVGEYDQITIERLVHTSPTHF